MSDEAKPIDTAALAAPFPPHKVHWRIGSTNKEKTKGLALAYLDARDVMERLDEVVGPENWQCRYPHANGKTCCEIGIYSERLCAMVWKANGAGDTDVEGNKGAFSDAFKRAAVLWGIGRYLYDLGNTWVEVEAKGRSTVIKDSEKAKLNRALHNLGEAKKPAPPKEPDPFVEDDDTLTEKYQAALVAIDAATTPDELAKAKAEHVTPIWKQLSGPEKDAIGQAGESKTQQFEQGEAA